MCGTCGCGQPERHDHARAQDHGHDHDHAHVHDHGHRHGPDAATEARRVEVETELLSRNDRIAAHVREWLQGQGILALNLVSSPGAGKTTLLERTLRDLGDSLACCVIEGDQQTDHDARRIAATGAPVEQVNTGAMCHLDAGMVHDALHRLAPGAGGVVFVENVGNLVCPSLFDLGEAAKVLVASVTEGEDKPVKYPYMFRAAQLVLLNKMDLAPHVDFDSAAFHAYALRVNPQLEVIELSARTGQGMARWYAWLRAHRTPAGHAA